MKVFLDICKNIFFFATAIFAFYGAIHLAASFINPQGLTVEYEERDVILSDANDTPKNVPRCLLMDLENTTRDIISNIQIRVNSTSKYIKYKAVIIYPIQEDKEVFLKVEQKNDYVYISNVPSLNPDTKLKINIYIEDNMKDEMSVQYFFVEDVQVASSIGKSNPKKISTTSNGNFYFDMIIRIILIILLFVFIKQKSRDYED